MVKVVVIGLGPLGQRVVRFAAERGNISIAGAVDIDPEIAGRDLGLHCGLERMGILISSSLAGALRRKRADVALLTTVSALEKLEPQAAEIAPHGLDIVSTCEELSYPFDTSPKIAGLIDAVCKRHGITCLGTGVNPGFLMDCLPAVLTAVSQRVSRITVRRFQDASSRRIPFQQKIGAGLTLAEFRKKKAAGTLRHVGLAESVGMIARAMGWKLTRITESLQPVVAGELIASGYKPIEPGMAVGVEQVGRGYLGKREVVTLHFRASVGEARSFDEVEIEGEPNIRSLIEGGVNGDIATCAILLNAIRSVRRCPPGLVTMIDVPPVTFNE